MASVILPVGATTARADTLSGCYTANECYIFEAMGNGDCQAHITQTDSNELIDPTGSFAMATYSNDSTGYTCNFFFERNVNFTGWYKINTVSLPSTLNGSGYSPNEWNGPGYEARVCLQFNWGSSLGATHCSPLIAQILLILPSGRFAGAHGGCPRSSVGRMSRVDIQFASGPQDDTSVETIKGSWRRT
jgi:hypothetical protein